MKEIGVDSDDICTLEDVQNIDPKSTSLFLVDHNVPRGQLAELFQIATQADTVKIKGIIDHHVDEQLFSNQRADMDRLDIRKSGSCATLVTQWFMGEPSPLTSSSESRALGLVHEHPEEASGIAQLLLSAILIDTANLSNTKVTDIDRAAVEFLVTLLPNFGVAKFYDQIRTAKMSIDGMSFRDLLRRDYKEYNSPLGKLGMSTIIRSIPDLRDLYQNFKEELLAYIKERNLAVHIILTVSVKESEVKRGGMIVSNNRDVVTQFKKQGTEEFRLSDADTASQKLSQQLPENWTGWVFEQGDLNSSRKQVEPFVMRIMNEIGRG